MEELSGIFGRITDRMIFKFEDSTTIFHATRQIIEATRVGNLDVEAQTGKRKLTHDSEKLEEYGGIDAADQGIGSQGNYEICRKCGGAHGFACHRFRCFKCGERGHLH